MTELSPAAQAILTAVTQSQYCLDPSDLPNGAARMASIVAAALQAAADRVVPELSGGDCSYDCCITQCEEIRAELLAIAAELRGTNPH